MDFSRHVPKILKSRIDKISVNVITVNIAVNQNFKYFVDILFVVLILTFSTSLMADEGAVLTKKTIEENFTKCGTSYLTFANEDSATYLFELKGASFDIYNTTKKLTEADALNGITWQGGFRVVYKAYRYTLYEINGRRTGSNHFSEWKPWLDMWKGYSDKSRISYNIIKINGSFVVTDQYNHVIDNGHPKPSCDEIAGP